MRFLFCRFLLKHAVRLFLAWDAVRRLANLNWLNSNLLDLMVKKHRRQMPAQFRLEVKRMSFNYGREEKKWRLWKEAEEKELRGLGVDEDTIEKLHTYDWAVFNSDRRYYRRLKEAGTYLEDVAEDTTQPEVKTVADFLESIENPQLYQVLVKADRLTLQIIVMQLQGYSTHDIASLLGMTEQAIYKRVNRLKEKIKKFLR